MWRLALAFGVACSGESSTRGPSLEQHATAPRIVADAAPIPDAPVDALAALRTRDPNLADVIARRVAQTSAKMKLSVEQGQTVAAAVLAVLDRPPVQVLARVMPRSTVELARAAAERGVSLEELDAIASYLARVVATIQPQRLATFDDNHSHVTGRDWHEIDYSGESMTWEGQRDAWVPKGVTSFKRAEYIHAYFVGAEKLAHWKRVYQPRGKMADLEKP